MDAVTDRPIRGQGTSESDWNAWPGLRHLRATTSEQLVPHGARAVVVAPHPDDEVLSVGGLLAQLARSGTSVCVVAVTDGTASHRGSADWPADRLVRVRPQESRDALRCLGIQVEPMRLGMPDGDLRDQRGQLAERLLPMLDRSDVIFTTWRQDGHPDHEATGHACAFAAARTGARLVEVPVWAWHWAAPGDERLPWHRAIRVDLDADAVSRKRQAVQCFKSQLEPDASTGAAPILRSTTVERAARPFEVMFT
ncbi:PIG-L deacetylase family protein [Variovorax sp. J22P240]|uniref:PIG-L deacetylase family protein n=1 Tax=unclassified Variovorax TaxID=663243 RepID=UPI0025769D86|nr:MULTISPECIES: PIG-L deacetylase family protein [unclassified Variovorax]MDL9997417.1 PIG-L deacetylase family protein [Variovorax sp. J22P240]MDM0047987.1 PIG-L deacetylase family protein [Variovorax sp. J22R115]